MTEGRYFVCTHVDALETLVSYPLRYLTTDRKWYVTIPFEVTGVNIYSPTTWTLWVIKKTFIQEYLRQSWFPFLGCLSTRGTLWVIKKPFIQEYLRQSWFPFLGCLSTRVFYVPSSCNRNEDGTQIHYKQTKWTLVQLLILIKLSFINTMAGTVYNMITNSNPCSEVNNDTEEVWKCNLPPNEISLTPHHSTV